MPKANDFFPSNYLRCADLGGKERSVTIDHITSELFENDGRKQAKPVVHFKDNGVKPLVSNKTNFMLIAAVCGEDIDNWAGKQITLVPELVQFKGQVTEAVRVKRPPSVPEPKPEFNDEVPWK